jgi:hypothetical protein
LEEKKLQQRVAKAKTQNDFHKESDIEHVNNLLNHFTFNIGDMYVQICMKHGMNCLLCSLQPSDFPLVPETRVRENRIGGMIKCGHVTTKY